MESVSTSSEARATAAQAQGVCPHFHAAIELIGAERYRMWVAYLAGVTVGFEHGPMRIYQTVAGRQADAASLPPTRADLYADAAARVLEPV